MIPSLFQSPDVNGIAVSCLPNPRCESKELSLRRAGHSPEAAIGSGAMALSLRSLKKKKKRIEIKELNPFKQREDPRQMKTHTHTKPYQ
jgi:hypothetical protein